MLIAELGGGAPWVLPGCICLCIFPEPTGACFRPADGLKHACAIHAVVKCKRSEVVNSAVPYPSYLKLIKIKQLAIVIAF